VGGRTPTTVALKRVDYLSNLKSEQCGVLDESNAASSVVPCNCTVDFWVPLPCCGQGGTRVIVLVDRIDREFFCQTQLHVQAMLRFDRDDNAFLQNVAPARRQNFLSRSF
jgi:hypothetical protein